MSIKSPTGLLKKYDAAPSRVQAHFLHFKKLVEDFPYEVAWILRGMGFGA